MFVIYIIKIIQVCHIPLLYFLDIGFNISNKPSKLPKCFKVPCDWIKRQSHWLSSLYNIIYIHMAFYSGSMFLVQEYKHNIGIKNKIRALWPHISQTVCSLLMNLKNKDIIYICQYWHVSLAISFLSFLSYRLLLSQLHKQIAPLVI